ncbi:hypothetical protein O181_055563 [Austropuccinia psidii MF-1]|uniref:Uncharacterized protein n=1 Tax=Austropuccinia psidii MF-1 TaxID=1389203 RepID=A0A9Q3EBF1_9BASI|nr:hypothetical protein [Austropuccinia psidii MF-1]
MALELFEACRTTFHGNLWLQWRIKKQVAVPSIPNLPRQLLPKDVHFTQCFLPLWTDKFGIIGKRRCLWMTHREQLDNLRKSGGRFLSSMLTQSTLNRSWWVNGEKFDMKRHPRRDANLRRDRKYFNFIGHLTAIINCPKHIHYYSVPLLSRTPVSLYEEPTTLSVNGPHGGCLQKYLEQSHNRLLFALL